LSHFTHEEWSKALLRSADLFRRRFEQARDDGVEVANFLSNDVDFPLNALSLFERRQWFITLKRPQALQLCVLRFPNFLNCGLPSHDVIWLAIWHGQVAFFGAFISKFSAK
jgi:hypothetical protein